jgi:hypothetical protein
VRPRPGGVGDKTEKAIPHGANVAEVPGSHAIYVSNPSAVAALIEQAARSVK